MRNRNSALLAKVEGTEGEDAGPVPGTDAVLVENLDISFDANIIQTAEHTGSLDGRGPIVGGMKVQVSFDILLKGSGAAGVAPEWGRILRACGWAEEIRAAATPAAPEACAAGGTATSAVLGVSASAIAQAYRGLPIVLSGAVAGDSVIADYTAGKAATLVDQMGGAIEATTNWQLPPAVLYRPASVAIPSLTLHAYKDGLLYRVVGARGTGPIELASGGVGRIKVQMTGMFGAKVDAPVPAGLVYDATRPPIWKGGRALIDRHRAAMATLSVTMGNEMTNPDNPNAEEGFDPAAITARNMTGQCDPLEELVATRDTMTAFRSGTPQIVHARYGAVAGNRIALTVPAAIYTAHNPGDRQGLMMIGLGFACTGEDAGAFLVLY